MDIQKLEKILDDIYSKIEKIEKEIESLKPKVPEVMTISVSELSEWIEKEKAKMYQSPLGCLHLSCSNCSGTGVDTRGQACIHFISCNCPQCSPSYTVSG